MIDVQNRITRMQRQVMRVHQKLARKRMQQCPHCGLYFGPQAGRVHVATHAAIIEATIPPPPDFVPDSWTEGGQ